MSDKKARIQYWDMAKGFTILLVIIGHIKCKSIFESNHIFVSYAILFYGKWLFCQRLFCRKYDQKGSEKPAYSVFYCMYDIHCLVYGGGLAADRDG